MILYTGGQTWYNYFIPPTLFYTTYISVDLAHHKIFCTNVGKGGIKFVKDLMLLLAWTQYERTGH